MKNQSDQESCHVSIIIVPLLGASHVRDCLKAIMGQQGAPSCEVIVPYDEKVSNVSEIVDQFPSVKFLSLEGRRTYAELRAFGIQQATGTLVAITEDHCVPDPGWCKALVVSHQRSSAAVGGPVEKHEPDSAMNWALYFADYFRYASPLPEGEVEHLTDCNVSYKMASLQAIESVWKEEFHEPEVHKALLQRGSTLWFCPLMIVSQRRPVQLGDALADRFTFGRLFGSGRAPTLSFLQRGIYAVLSLVLPLLTVGRIGLQVKQKRRHRIPFVRAFPALLLLNAVWAFGECVGYVTGRSSSDLTPKAQNLSRPTGSAGRTLP